LERQASTHNAGILYVWRLPEESEAEALARCVVDPADFPEVRVDIWYGGQASPRLARPPDPCWIAQTPPADLPYRLRDALRRAYGDGEERP
jgi:hypothetical protein